MEVKQKKDRDCGVDLLRIFLALMVVGLHFNARATGGVAVAVSDSPFIYIVNMMVALCYPAVNTYVLISGYYSYKQKKSYVDILFSLVKLWICLLFFSVFGYIVVTIVNDEHFSFYNLLLRCFPLSRGVWWFMTNYFVMMLLSPMMNMIIDSHSLRGNFSILLVSLIICSVIPFFLKWEDMIGVHYGYSIIWFVVLYYTGAMLRFVKFSFTREIHFCIFLILTVSFIIINSIFSHLSFMKGYHVSMYNSLVVYFQAIFLFLTFVGMQIKLSKLRTVIISLSSLSLAVYIFHCQEDIGPFIWDTLKPARFANSWFVIPLFVYTVFGIYIISVSIEFLRKRIGGFMNVESHSIKMITNGIVKIFCIKFNYK